MITDKQADVLHHTMTNGRYVTGETDVIALARAGLLHDHGAQQLAGGMHYLTLTNRGRDALREWFAVQPPPPKPKRRRRSEVFDSWMTYCEVSARISFAEFLREVWPHRRSYL